jgi:hypothetical protein
VVPASEYRYRSLLGQVRELQRPVGKKTMKALTAIVGVWVVLRRAARAQGFNLPTTNASIGS